MATSAGDRDPDPPTVLIGSVEATIAVLFAVVALGPIVAERLHIPGIVGLIAGGVVFGPFVVGWLESDGLVSELGSIGILYLMFLAGLSFDIKAFSENRRAAITYGLLGFFLPFVLTVAVVNQADDIETLGALLIGAMWASNTLIAYPEVQAAGLQGTRSVGAAVSAGVVADLLSLTVMAFATATEVIEIEPGDLPFAGAIIDQVAPEGVEPTTPDPALPLWIGLPLLALVCLWVLPRVADWYFVRVGRTRPQRFVFTLALMGTGSMFALLGGMEGLIGAFLAGLGMNRLVPARGPLMERLDFVGTTAFIPVFLVSIGLTIDPALLVDPETIGLGLLFTGFVLVGKSAAALVTGLLYRMSFNEIGLMSSLSFGQAASTLAIAEVGSNLGMFEQNVVNAAVLAIVITAFITSYATRFFASRVPAPEVDRPPLGRLVLLDTRANGSDPTTLIALAGGIARADDGVVAPYAVSDDTQRSFAQDAVARSVEEAAARGLDVDGVLRVDDSFINATVNLVAELDSSVVLLDWGGPHWAADYLFGNDIDGVGGAAPVPAIAAHVVRPWERIVVHLGHPTNAWERADTELATDVALRLRALESSPVVVVGDDPAWADELVGAAADVTVVERPTDPDALIEYSAIDDLVVVPAHVVRDLPPWRARRLARAFHDVSLAVVGGPHRLTISQGVTRRPLSTAVSATSTGP